MPRERPAPEPFEPDWLQRSLDRYYLAGLVFMLVLVAGFPLYKLREPHLRRDALQAQHATYARIGGHLFHQICEECHGANATGGDAPTLNSKEFLATTSDAQIEQIVSAGITGTEMAAVSADYGGPFTNEQIREVVTYLRSLEAHAPSVPNWREGKPATGTAHQHS